VTAAQSPFRGTDARKSFAASPFAWAALGLALLALPVGAGGQAPTHGTDPSDSSPRVDSTSPAAANVPMRDPVQAARELRAMNIARYQAIIEDTNRLLKLTRELDEEIARTSPVVLTPAELSKIGEIQKLAHRVRTNMSQSIRDSASP